MGVAAMLKNQWPDAGFRFASLSDRKPVSEDDDLIVLAAPDPQGWSLTLAMSSEVAKCKSWTHCSIASSSTWQACCSYHKIEEVGVTSFHELIDCISSVR